MQYERFILFTLALLTVSVCFYIFFIEKQSLFSNRDVVEPDEQPYTKNWPLILLIVDCYA